MSLFRIRCTKTEYSIGLSDVAHLFFNVLNVWPLNLPTEPLTDLPTESLTNLPQSAMTNLTSEEMIALLTDLSSESLTDLLTESRTVLMTESHTDLKTYCPLNQQENRHSTESPSNVPTSHPFCDRLHARLIIRHFHITSPGLALVWTMNLSLVEALLVIHSIWSLILSANYNEFTNIVASLHTKFLKSFWLIIFNFCLSSHQHAKLIQRWFSRLICHILFPSSCYFNDILVPKCR